jgi:hypothetical protein
VLLARLRAGAGEGAAEVGAPFTDRLVEKFGLPVTGWRGRGAVGRNGADRDRESPDQDGADRDRAAGERDEEPGGDA